MYAHASRARLLTAAGRRNNRPSSAASSSSLRQRPAQPALRRPLQIAIDRPHADRARLGHRLVGQSLLVSEPQYLANLPHLCSPRADIASPLLKRAKHAAVRLPMMGWTPPRNGIAMCQGGAAMTHHHEEEASNGTRYHHRNRSGEAQFSASRRPAGRVGCLPQEAEVFGVKYFCRSRCLI